MYVSGIDPGKDGALALIGDGKLVDRWPTPYLPDGSLDLPEFCKLVSNLPAGCNVFLERVHAIYGSSATGTFEFGRAWGMAETALVMAKLPYTMVPPKTWQKEAWQGIVEIRKPSTVVETVDKKTGEKVKKEKPGAIDTKAMSLLAVKRLFPDADLRRTEKSKKPHEGIVDAILIALYGYRVLTRGV